MEGFTPTFFLQLLLAVGSGGAVYGAIKSDLKNMHHRLTEEREAREELVKTNAESHHDIRNKLGDVSNKVARLEGANDLAERIAQLVERRK